MINKISFGSGKVFCSGSTKNLSNKQETNKIREFARKQKCDVVLLNRDFYFDNSGIYDAILVKEDETGNNMFAKTVFDFRKESNIKEKELPSFSYTI